MPDYFVVYSHCNKNRPNVDIGPTNTILRGVHPVSWAANPPQVFRDTGNVTTLHFWAEIPPCVTDTRSGWCDLEDHSSPDLTAPPPLGDWIPVESFSPRPGDRYLVWGKLHDFSLSKHHGVYEAERDRNGVWRSPLTYSSAPDENCEILNVTHIIALPTRG